MTPAFYRHVQPSARLAPDAFASPDGREVRLETPLLVQTPALTLASPVWDPAAGEAPPHAHLALPPGFAAFAADVEAALLAAAVANKEAWFGREVADRTVLAAFKPRCKPGGHLTVALPPAGAEVFDAAGDLLQPGDLGVGDEARCILRLDGVAFGRTEFEGSWTLVQAQARPAPPPPPPGPRCLLSPEDDDDGGDDKTEVGEFP